MARWCVSLMPQSVVVNVSMPQQVCVCVCVATVPVNHNSLEQSFISSFLRLSHILTSSCLDNYAQVNCSIRLSSYEARAECLLPSHFDVYLPRCDCIFISPKVTLARERCWNSGDVYNRCPSAIFVLVLLSIDFIILVHCPFRLSLSLSLSTSTSSRCPSKPTESCPLSSFACKCVLSSIESIQTRQIKHQARVRVCVCVCWCMHTLGVNIFTSITRILYL